MRSRAITLLSAAPIRDDPGDRPAVPVLVRVPDAKFLEARRLVIHTDCHLAPGVHPGCDVVQVDVAAARESLAVVLALLDDERRTGRSRGRHVQEGEGGEGRRRGERSHEDSLRASGGDSIDKKMGDCPRLVLGEAATEVALADLPRLQTV